MSSPRMEVSYSDPSVTEAPVPQKIPCHICGCGSRFDDVGDRICWCDACTDGCKNVAPKIYIPCYECGCITRLDEFGDRVCWCDACTDGCKNVSLYEPSFDMGNLAAATAGGGYISTLAPPEWYYKRKPGECIRDCYMGCICFTMGQVYREVRGCQWCGDEYGKCDPLGQGLTCDELRELLGPPEQ